MKKIDSIAYTLGIYLAKYLISREIPSLSCNQCTRKVVEVTPEEAKETERLSDAWYSKRTSEERRITKGLEGAERYKKEREAHKLSEKEWNEDMKYRYMLKEKYLPHTLKCNVPFIDFSDEETSKEIKKGLINTLWDWDFCEWSLKEEDIIFENEELKYGDNEEYNMRFTNVTLKLCLEIPSSYTGKDWIEIKTEQKKL